ncbi:MAG: galactokinase [Bacteroidales bacterium]|nr:galactokinase [Bacteroidales bacterium]
MDYSAITTQFNKRYGSEYSLYASPGRVNLIGEHTDYNGGFVFPGAIDKLIVAAIKPNDTEIVRVYSYDMKETAEFALDEKPTASWALYIYGVISEISKRGLKVGGFDCVFGGDIPIGSGLSTSAALESTFAFALNDLFNLGLARIDMALIGQAAEHNAVGVRCGIMDQFASVFGETDHLIRLDCRSLEYELVPFHPKNCRLVLLDTQVKHNLAASEYNIRRAECEEGVATIQKKHPQVKLLRDVSLDLLNDFKKELKESTYRRCRYVIEENQRLLDACEALKHDNYTEFGKKMYGSHEGLSKEYNVSCKELDFLVSIAIKNGALGARMMGGGFGGCTINLLEESHYAAFVEEAIAAYKIEFNKAPKIYEVKIGKGSHKIA